MQCSSQMWPHVFARTCEEPEGRVRLWAHYFDPAEEGESDAVGGLGESLDVPTGPGLCVPELAAGEGQDVEVRGAQLPVQSLQRPVVRLRLLAVTRHVYNQRRLCRGGKTGWNYALRKTLKILLMHWNPHSADTGQSAKNLQQFLVKVKRLVMMWTYFSSVPLQRNHPPLRVFDLERIKVRRFSRLQQLRLQQEQTAHTDCHAQQDRQLLRFWVGGPGRVAP